jgi:hypothetical protein
MRHLLRPRPRPRRRRICVCHRPSSRDRFLDDRTITSSSHIAPHSGARVSVYSMYWNGGSSKHTKKTNFSYLISPALSGRDMHARLHPVLCPTEGKPDLTWDLTRGAVNLSSFVSSARVPLAPDELALPCSHPPLSALRVRLHRAPSLRKTFKPPRDARYHDDALSLSALVQQLSEWMGSHLSVESWRALPKDVREHARAAYARRAGPALGYEDADTTPYLVADLLGDEPMFLALERDGHSWLLRTCKRSSAKTWR